MAANIKLGTVLTDADGTRFMAVSLYPSATTVAAFSFVRMPDGSTIHDLGRTFQHAPALADPHAFELIVHGR